MIVNLAVSTGFTRDLGVEGHIGEVQLMLDIWSFMLVRFRDVCSMEWTRNVTSWESKLGD